MPTSSHDVMALVVAAVKRTQFGWEVVAEETTADAGGTRHATKMVKRSPMPGRFAVRALGHYSVNVRFILSTNHREPPHQPIEVQLSEDIVIEDARDPVRLMRMLRDLAMRAWLHEFDEWWLVDGQRQDPHDDERPAPFGFPLNF